MLPSGTDNYPQDHILSGLTTDEAVTKNLACKIADGGEVENCDTAGERSLGVMLDTQTTVGKPVAVLAGPSFKQVVSGAEWTGYALATDADGKYRTATAGQVAIAIACELATAADQLKRALILPQAQYRIASASIVDLTDNSGLSGTHDDTLAAVTVPADLAGGEDPTEAEFNALLAVIRVMAQNQSDIAQKVKEIVAVLDAQGITL